MAKQTTTSNFRDAVDKTFHTMQLGENGFPEYTDFGVRSEVLALSQMVRGGNPTSLANEIIANGTNQDVADLAVLLFQTRNARGGKGEKDLSYKIFLSFWKSFPETAARLLRLFAHYGYWKDFLRLMVLAKNDRGTSSLTDEAIKIMGDRFLKDVAALAAYRAELAVHHGDEAKCKKLRKEGPKLSLLAKWLPRERSSFDKKIDFVNRFTGFVWPEASASGESNGTWQSKNKTRYRKVVAEMTSYFELPEVLLSLQRADEVNFHKVASKATLLLTKAFLNEDKQGQQRSNDAKRIRLAELFVEHLIAHGAKGGQVMPHEIVRKILSGRRITRSEELVLDAQWKDLVKTVVDQVKAKAASEGIEFNPTRMVPLTDVSGSMYGVPMEVSIALGILISEITHEAFQNMVLTFETQPRWHRLIPSDSIVKKVRSLKEAPWGGSTNFMGAYQLILQVCKEHKLDREDVPSLIVFSDMQFNQAAGCYYKPGDMVDIQSRIDSDFAVTGKGLGWTDLTPKPIVYWNLRNTGGHPVNKDTEGAILLAGFSPSLLKLVMNGDALREEEVEVVKSDGTVTTEKVRVTPEQVLRKLLDDSLYDPVRAILSSSNEGVLREYTIDASPDDMDIDDDAFVVVSSP